ncbi:arginase family protein [Gulosibacter sp. 10]|uniref:arginase family protein n=1 Tax=Gulosibacter sp. 10 TaxID=1255570 RepID=UPI00097EFE7D|nr:arginase family protein [Gulosibacter sp. 10]SJM59419.1 Arginase [Gulosibacter sp. 10]
MTSPATPLNDARTLRLVWPQWQGAGRSSVGEFLPELPFEYARRAYAIGSRMLDALLPPHDGPTEVVPVDGGDPDEGAVDGIESRSALSASLAAAQEALGRHDVDRILTLGGECSVSVAPFAALAERYGDDLAVIWLDAHPDVDTNGTGYSGYHAMAVSTLIGRGDPEFGGRLPATIPPERVALTGLHSWEEDAYAHVAEWGLPAFGPEALRETTAPLLEWLAGTGASRVAIHLDVDVVDSDEVRLGLGADRGGLTRAQVRRIVEDVAERADVVGLTIAEFIPRDVLALDRLVRGLPLIG